MYLQVHNIYEKIFNKKKNQANFGGPLKEKL